MIDPTKDCRAKPDSDPWDVCPICRACLILRGANGDQACADPTCTGAHGFDCCLFCGTAVTPGHLIGNTLANGAMPAMVKQSVAAMRLHTAETDQLRRRVADLEAILAKIAKPPFATNAALTQDEVALLLEVQGWKMPAGG